MDRCFVDSQFLRIRRLVDGGITGKGIHGHKGVFSLISLLEDMKANVSVITRRNLFLIDEIQYDYDPVRQKELDSLLALMRHESIDFYRGSVRRNDLLKMLSVQKFLIIL